MFDNLIESKARKPRTLGQTVFSIAVHGLLAFAAIKATQGVAETMDERVIDTTMVFLKALKAPEPPPPPPPPTPEEVVVSANPPPKGFQTIVAPTDIPKDIPPVDLNQKAFDPRDFTGKGVEGGLGTGIVGGTGPVDVGSVVVSSAEADDPPSVLSPGPLQPPAGMAGVPGQVSVQFIVDTTGRAEPASYKVISSTNKVFEAPARAAVLKTVFRPGRQGGRLVRVLVRQNVKFDIGA